MRLRLFALVLAVLPMVGCDYATKDWAETSLQGSAPISVVPDVFELTYARNFDVAFNALRTIPEAARLAVIVAAGASAIALVAFLSLRRGRPRVEAAGYAFVLAGALGNLSDRLTRGYVVDFLYLHHWPVFNVADVWIVLGVGLLGLSALRASRPGIRRFSH